MGEEVADWGTVSSSCTIWDFKGFPMSWITDFNRSFVWEIAWAIPWLEICPKPDTNLFSLIFSLCFLPIFHSHQRKGQIRGNCTLEPSCTLTCRAQGACEMKFVLTAEGQAQRGPQCCPVTVPRQGCKVWAWALRQERSLFPDTWQWQLLSHSWPRAPDPRGYLAPRSPTTFSECSHAAAQPFPLMSMTSRGAQPFSTAPENTPG